MWGYAQQSALYYYIRVLKLGEKSLCKPTKQKDTSLGGQTHFATMIHGKSSTFSTFLYYSPRHTSPHVWSPH